MRVVFALSAICVTLGMVSCSESPEIANGDSASVSSETGKLRILSWGEYIDPLLLEEFTERTGIEAGVIEFENSEEMIAMLHSSPGDFDLVIADPISQVQLQELSLLKELDHAELENLSNVGDEFLSPSWDADNRYSIPYLVGATIVAYRKDKIPDPEKSWAILFDPKFSGRVALLDEYEDVLAAALQLDGKPAQDGDAESLSGAKDRILEHIREGNSLFGSFGESMEALDSGKVWVAMNYNGDAAQWARDNPAIDYFVPKEGSIRWMDSFVVSRDAADMKAVYSFLNFMMEGETAARSASKFCLVPANKSAFRHLPRELVSDSRIFLDHGDLSRSEMLLPFSDPTVKARYTKAMHEIAVARRNESSELGLANSSEEGGRNGELK